MKSKLSGKLGLRIKELRLARKIKQCDLADMLGMERSNLTRIESGKQRPTDENLEKIAKILDVKLPELFDVIHIETKEELLKNISEILSTLNEKELRFCYKTLLNLKELK